VPTVTLLIYNVGIVETSNKPELSNTGTLPEAVPTFFSEAVPRVGLPDKSE